MLRTRVKTAVPFIVYFCLAILILGPLLRPGYIFLLDYVAGPHLFFNLESTITSGIPLSLVRIGLAYILTPMVAQKLIVLLVIFMAGIAMHFTVPVKGAWARYCAGFLYVINPFVFARLQAGHIGLLFVYAVTPWVAQSLFRFLEKPEQRTAAIAGVWLAVAAMMAPHGLYLFLVLGFGLVVYLWCNRFDRVYWVSLLKPLAVLLAVFVVLSAFWLAPATLVKSPVAGIDSGQIEIFAAQTDQRAGAYLSIAAMNGFWQMEIFESKNAVPSWPYLFLILFTLAVWGLAAGIRDEEKRPDVLIVGLTAVIAFVFALGTASPATAWLYRFLFENISAFRGFREPQKFVALLVFAYAYLGSIGLDDLMNRLEMSRSRDPAVSRPPALEGRGLGGGWLPSRVSGTPTLNSSPLQRGRKSLLSVSAFPFPVSRFPFLRFLLAAFFIIVVIVYTWPMFWGLGGHVKSVDYPQSWYRAEEIMSKDSAAGAVFFLPWHLYMPMSFNDAGKVVANPAPHFFKRDVIYGKNAELTGASTIKTDKRQKTFEDILTSGKGGESIAGELRKASVRYVVLAKEADWPIYNWLSSQNDLEKVFSTNEITVWRVN